MNPRPRLALTVALTLALTACRTSEPWTFALSRRSYGPDASYVEHLVPRDAARPAEWCALGVLAAAPLALDVVLLPVAVTRDLCVRGHLEK